MLDAEMNVCISNIDQTHNQINVRILNFCVRGYPIDSEAKL